MEKIMIEIDIGFIRYFFLCSQYVQPWHSLSQILNRHMLAYSDRDCDNMVVMNPGILHWREGGEKHINDPQSIANLQVQCNMFCGFYFMYLLAVLFQRFCFNKFLPALYYFNSVIVDKQPGTWKWFCMYCW